MKQRKFLKRLLLFLFTVAVFSSCVDKNYELSNISDEGSFAPSAPFPLGSLQKSVTDLLLDYGVGQKGIIVSTDDSIYIAYTDTFQFSSNNDSMLPVLDAEFQIDFFTNLMTNREFTFDIDIPLDSWSDALDSVQLINSEVTILVNESKLSTNAQFELSFPNGIEFEDENASIEIPAGARNNNHVLKLKDHSIFKLEKQQDKYLLRISALLKVDPSEILTPLNNVNLTISFSKFDMEIAWGEFNNVTFEPIIGDANIGVFNGLEESGSLLSFSNPTLVCNVYNYIGVPGTFKIDSLQTYSESEGYDEVSEAEFEGGKKSYEKELMAAPSPNQPSSPTSITFDKNNGSIDRLFFQDKHPNHIKYNFSFDVGNDPGFLILKDNKYIDVVVEARLPLSFNDGTQLNNRDTLDMDLSGNSAVKSVEDLIFWIDYENRFGVNIELDVRFLDENRRELESLSNVHEIKSADVRRNTADDQPKLGKIEIKFDKNQLSDLKKTHYIVLATTTTTTSGVEVSIHPKDYLKLTFSFYVGAEI
jgi:hypothetical protein